MIKFTHDFVKDFDLIAKAIVEQEPFAFVRFGEGEAKICRGEATRRVDSWSYPGGETYISKYMNGVLKNHLDDFYVGIPCKCCDPEGWDWFRQQVDVEADYVSYANMFVNGNYTSFMYLYDSHLAKNSFLVGCYDGADYKIPRNAIEQVLIGTWKINNLMTALLRVDKPILLAAGPLANMVAYEYWVRQAENLKQPIIDIGSTLDPKFKGKGTRRYHNAKHKNRKKVCKWLT